MLNNACKEIFGTDDENKVSKKRMENTISQMLAEIKSLTFDLFCENPNHTRYRLMSDTDRSVFVRAKLMKTT